MKDITKEFAVLLILFCFFLMPFNGFSQETETKENYFTDSVYAFIGVSSTNIFLNYANRLANAHFANLTFIDIWDNIYADPDWMWEDGDRFHVNQIGHAYLGAVYFASARVNGFNFYQSIPAVFLGAVMWEMIFEPEPAYNDVISTTLSGMALGEMMYRLFLEVDTKKSFGSKVGGFFISPSSSQNKIYNRPHREIGGGNIYDLTLKLGANKSFAFFPEYKSNEKSWKNPGGHIDVDVIYGDPFLQQSKKPYDHFELYAGFTMTNTFFNAVVISDGYIFSENPTDTDKKVTSTGLSMHYDFFDASDDFMNNEGTGNIHFSGSAIGWTLKHKYNFSEKSYFEIKTHANAVLWGASTYNNININLWGQTFDSNCTFGPGENIKLSFSLAHKKVGKLDFDVSGYHIFAIPFNERHLKGNVFFLYSELKYDFPFNERVGLGIKGAFWWLYGVYESDYKVDRRLSSNCMYVWLKF